MVFVLMVCPDLVGHLQQTFPGLYRLYEVLAKWNSPLTQEEIDIATGKKKMDDILAKKYLNELKTISRNVHEMFQEQQARNKVSQLFIPFDL